MSELSSSQMISVKSFGVVTQETIDQFAELSGDKNPIHLDPNVAGAMGFRSTIVHGMLLAGFIHSRALQEQTENRSLGEYRLEKSDMKFKKPVYVGAEISVGGYWDYTDMNELKMELWLRSNQSEDPHVLGRLYWSRSSDVTKTASRT